MSESTRCSSLMRNTEYVSHPPKDYLLEQRERDKYPAYSWLADRSTWPQPSVGHVTHRPVQSLPPTCISDECSYAHREATYPRAPCTPWFQRGETKKERNNGHRRILKVAGDPSMLQKHGPLKKARPRSRHAPR